MPRFIVPKKHGPHRIAAIALFRALLRQCDASPFSRDQRGVLQNIVRNSFKRNANNQSTRLLSLAFHAGYEALDHLDASIAGSAPSIDRISDVINRAPKYLTRTSSQARPKPKPPARISTTPPRKSTLESRPYPNVEGIRRIPSLVSANGIPFLRYQKPQPKILSDVIRAKVKQLQRRLDLRDELEAHWHPIAALEDQWDAIVWEQHEVGAAKGVNDPQSWLSEVERQKRLLTRHMGQARENNMRLAQKMMIIRDREIELARQEKEARAAEKKANRRNVALESKHPKDQ